MGFSAKDDSGIREINLPKISDLRGNLTFIQPSDKLPLNISKVEWIYDVKTDKETRICRNDGSSRLVVALAGSTFLYSDDTDSEDKAAYLYRPDTAIIDSSQQQPILQNVASNTVLLILTLSDSDSNPNDTGIGNSSKDSHNRSLLNQCGIIPLKQSFMSSYSMSGVDNFADPIFKVRRVFYLYDVPADSERGGHSHFEGQELIIAAGGCFDVILDDGHHRQKFTLNRPYNALYIPAGIWREINNFSSGSVCMVLTSTQFSETDYCRDYQQFKLLTANKKD